MITMDAQGVLHFHPDHELVTERYLSAEGIEKPLPNHLFHILVTNIVKAPQNMNKDIVSVLPTDHIDKMNITDLQASEDGLSPKTVIRTVVT